MPARNCPDPDLLADYALGKTSAADLAGIASHLEACAACQSRLEALDGLSDTIIACLRQAGTDAADSDDSLLKEVLCWLDSITSEYGPGSAEPAEEAVLPWQVGQYRLFKKLGQGSMGCVYLAEDEALRRQVAVKVPCRRWFSSDEELQRSLAEARAAAGLKHAGIVPVFYFGREPDGMCYLVMEYIEGPSLAERLQSGPIPPAEAAAMMAAVAEAVAEIHKRGYVHRDLKPRNILLDAQRRPHVADFGLALDESAQRRLVRDRSGTLAYMPPEQVQGKARWLDGRADLWALGVILYEMLAGRRPFSGDTRAELEDEILHRDPRPPRQHDPAVPPELERICLKCLAKDVTGRYATADDLAGDLRHWLRPRPRRRAVLAAAAVLAALLAALGYQRFFAPVNRPSGPGRPALTGTVDALVWNSSDPSRRWLSLKDAAPLRPGDGLRIEAKLNRRAYVYLVWIDGQGQASPLYPWKPGDWTSRRGPESPVDHLSLPPEADEYWPVRGPGGVETLLLLAREEPLPGEFRLDDRLSGLPRQPAEKHRFACFDNGRLVTEAADHDRGLGLGERGRIDDEVLKAQRLIYQRLSSDFPLVRAVTCVSHGSEK
jgi:serine/threonine protein kinase